MEQSTAMSKGPCMKAAGLSLNLHSDYQEGTLFVTCQYRSLEPNVESPFGEQPVEHERDALARAFAEGGIASEPRAHDRTRAAFVGHTPRATGLNYLGRDAGCRPQQGSRGWRPPSKKTTPRSDSAVMTRSAAALAVGNGNPSSCMTGWFWMEWSWAQSSRPAS